jgi:hypothetical protein
MSINSPIQVTVSDSLFETLRERFATEIRQLAKRDRRICLEISLPPKSKKLSPVLKPN